MDSYTGHISSHTGDSVIAQNIKTVLCFQGNFFTLIIKMIEGYQLFFPHMQVVEKSSYDNSF